MTGLYDILRQQVLRNGPMTLADYMQQALLHPEHGYYCTRDPLGSAGDFTTSPEISQMFGELIGLALAQAWMDQGQPAPFVLAELGPGRGTLMADLWRATSSVPGFHDAAQLVLVEASQPLRDKQAAVVYHASPTWVQTVADLPEGPLFLVANEFFDALPIRQFQRFGQAWSERVVGLDGETLTLGRTAPAPLADLEHRLDDTRDGDIVETCAPGQGIMADIGRRIARHGGAALVIDYGDWRSLGDTLQALRAHQAVSPFDAPGQADLTAHVDFEALALAAAPACHSRLCPQGVFLERLGITGRAHVLAARLQGSARDSHIAAHRRLTHPQEMGTLFKVLGLYPKGGAVPAGLEP